MINLQEVSFTYEGSKECSLKKFNLKIASGECIVIIGESGCGKTTLSKCINGLIPHYVKGKLEGSISVNDMDIKTTPLFQISQHVGSVFQNPRSQFFNIDTTSEMAFGCENFNIPANEILERINAVTSNFKIKHLLGRNIFHLSGGEKQKIACASIATSNPQIIVLDEPSSNLDVDAIDDLREIITQWKKEGKTIVVVEHRLYYLKEVADRILRMVDGHIEEEWSPIELSQQEESFFHKRGLRSFIPQSYTKKDKENIDVNYIEYRNLHFHYNRKFPILDIKYLKIPQNSIIALIGKNGAGKSSLAKVLCGLEGHFFFRNRFNHSKAYLIMQDVNHQLFTSSVSDEILIGMEEENIETAKEILNDLNIFSFKDRHPMSLSGGQKQRVAIASGISSGRDMVIYDEPTSGLDYKQMIAVSQALKKLRSKGKTQIVITHDMELIRECCDYLIYIEHGKIIEESFLVTE